MTVRIVIEVLADEVADTIPLIREVATRLKKGKIESGKTVNYCIGDYRVVIEESDE